MGGGWGTFTVVTKQKIENTGDIGNRRPQRRACVCVSECVFDKNSFVDVGRKEQTGGASVEVGLESILHALIVLKQSWQTPGSVERKGVLQTAPLK